MCSSDLSLIAKDYYDYEIVGLPPFMHYFSFHDKLTEVEEKKAWYFENSMKNSKFVFKNALLEYCDKDVRLLFLSINEFLKETLQVQNVLKTNLLSDKEKSGNPRIIHPFENPHLTFSGYYYSLYRMLEGAKYDLTVQRNDHGLLEYQCSKLEKHWVLEKYEELKRPFDFLSKFTSTEIPRLGNVIPDFYCPSLNVVGFFNG